MSIKVYQNVLNFARTAESFLFLDGAGCSAEIPEDFWQSLASCPENVQSYLACLIARLISLESKQHGLRPLGDVYRELCMTGDDTKSFKIWLTKDGSWDQRRKHLAVYLQHAIISTIHHLKTFYGYVPHPCVKAMYTFWAYARGPEGYNPAGEFECKVLQDFAVVSTQQSSLGRWFYQIVEDEEELGRQVRELVGHCSRGHRQPSGALLDFHSPAITNSAAVAKSLSYYQLAELLRHNSKMADVAVAYILQKLHEVTTSSDVEESEITILPLLQLFKAIAPMAPQMNVMEAYQSLMPLYLWPQPYSCEARKVLDFLQADTRVKGTTFRKTVLGEHNVSSVKGLCTEQTTFVIIDRSNGVCRSSAFAKAFEATDSRLASVKVKKLLIKHVYMTLGDWDFDQLEDLEQLLQNCGPMLDDYCKELLSIAEVAASEQDGEDNIAVIQAELKRVHEQIVAQSKEDDGSSLVGKRESCSPSEDTGDPLQLSNYPMLPMEVKTLETPTPTLIENTLRRCLQESLAKDSKIQRKHNTTHGRIKRAQKRRSMERSRESTVVSDEPGGDHAENGWDQQLDSPTTKSPPKSPPFIQPLSTGADKDRPSRTSSLSSGEFPDLEHESSSPSHGSFISAEPLDTLNPRPTSAGSGSSPYVSPSGTMLFNKKPMSSPVRTRKGSTSHKTRTSVKYSSMKSKSQIVGAMSPDGTNSETLREVKIAVSGNDRTLSRMAQAYALLRQKEPDLFSNLLVQFYYIPLSVSTFTRSSEVNGRKKDSALPEYMMEHSQNSLLGEDVWLACYLSQFDSWYERNVLLAVHNALRIIPALDETEDTPIMRERLRTVSSPMRTVAAVPSSVASSHVPPSPPQILKEIVCSYCRNAESMAKLQMYKAQIQVKGDKNVRSVVRYFLQRLDVQKLTKKTKGTPKPFEAMIVVEELSLDDTHIPSQIFKFKDLWSLRASNVPRPEDGTLASPEADSLELSLVRGQKSADAEDLSFHVHKFVLEAKDKPFSLMLDSDFEDIIENVLRVEVEAARMRKLPTSLSPFGANAVTDETKEDLNIHFPLMTFWPLDLHSS